MKNTPLYSRTSAFLLAVFFCLPAAAFAASIYMEAPTGPVSVGNIITIPVYLDTDTPPVNVLDGTIALPSSSIASVTSISLAQSTFTLWPASPAVSADGKSITFTGGLPGGFTGKHQLLFTMLVKVIGLGTAVFTPANTTLYLNDGKGTPTPLTDEALSITVQSSKSSHTPIVPTLIVLALVLCIVAYVIWLKKRRAHTL